MSKIIFISSSLADVSTIKRFAKRQGYSLEHYSREEWRQKNRPKKTAQSPRPSKPKHLSIVPKLPTLNNQGLLPTMDDLKSTAIKNALLMSRGSAHLAAKALNISRATLYRKIKELDIDLLSIRLSVEEGGERIRVKKAA